MFNLIIKEILVQKKSILFVFFYSIFILIAFGLGNQQLAMAAYIMGTVAMTFILVQMGCARDDMNKSEIIFNSLPINRRTIVISKYVSAILFSIFNLSMMSTVGFLLSQFPFISVPGIRFIDVIIIFVSSWMFAALYLPIYFRCGYIKAKFFNMLVFFILFFGPSNVFLYIMRNPDRFVSRLFFHIFAGGEWTVVMGILLAALSIVLISMVVSIRFYKNREF